MRDPAERLADILEAIAAISRYATRDILALKPSIERLLTTLKKA
jgi:hypothetical protein